MHKSRLWLQVCGNTIAVNDVDDRANYSFYFILLIAKVFLGVTHSGMTSQVWNSDHFNFRFAVSTFFFFLKTLFIYLIMNNWILLRLGEIIIRCVFGWTCGETALAFVVLNYFNRFCSSRTDTTVGRGGMWVRFTVSSDWPNVRTCIVEGGLLCPVESEPRANIPHLTLCHKTDIIIS